MIRPALLAAAFASALAATLVSRAAEAQPAVAPPARGDADARERSRAAFRRGVAQAHDGDYPAARDSFLEAYKLFPHPSILLNLGISRARTGEWVDAEQDLVHF